ncbi:DnaT-like ssDNA-binding protein [Providencia sp. PROV132]|uniref:DnaT-like ssDNA-binding protein n=1 Tax=Providencia sp. PROV132 TaxID=2949842 RepID=UPI002349B19D|nr:DnaT-like ssDNA-binding protein [Providencia sp. PROV132]
MIDSDKTSLTFNSYASVADLKAYASARQLTLPNEGLEGLLIVAMDYLESQKWLGKRTDIHQPLSFPRTGLIRDGIAVSSEVIPQQVIQAQCRLAIESQENDLQPTLGGEIIAERIEGAIDLKYAEGTNTGAPNFAWLKGLLSGLIDISEGFAINTFAMR